MNAAVSSALLIFARYPRAGTVKTRLGRTMGMDEAARIYRQFAEHAFAIGKQLAQTGVEVYIFHDPSSSQQEMRSWVGTRFQLAVQEGETLGDRMKGAFEKTFQRGAKRSVIIGTDVPELGLGAVVDTLALLDRHDVVVGPSSDGGYYLVGMNAPLKDIFNNIAWSTDLVFRDTLGRIDALGLRSALLSEVPDVDTEEDYLAYLRRVQNV